MSSTHTAASLVLLSVTDTLAAAINITEKRSHTGVLITNTHTHTHTLTHTHTHTNIHTHTHTIREAEQMPEHFSDVVAALARFIFHSAGPLLQLCLCVCVCVCCSQS